MSGSCGIINLEDSISKIECYQNISKDSSSRKIIVENFSISENNTICAQATKVLWWYYGSSLGAMILFFEGTWESVERFGFP